jgi:hypothetical protein
MENKQNKHHKKIPVYSTSLSHRENLGKNHSIPSKPVPQENSEPKFTEFETADHSSQDKNINVEKNKEREKEKKSEGNEKNKV